MPSKDGAWKPTERGLALAAAHLDDVARLHTLHPRCALCGQHALALDKYGLCSKISDPHKTWRAEFRAEPRKARR